MESSSVPPNPRDVADFRFKALLNLPVLDKPFDNETGMIKNILAVSNRYGLVFVGSTKGFKIIRTVDIEKLDETKPSTKVNASSYPCQEVVLSSTLIHLAVNCDSSILAACVICDDCSYAEMYHMKTFTEKESSIESFIRIRLTSDPNAMLLDFIWNPSIRNMSAACLSDGSISVHEVSDNTMTIYGSLPPSTGASAICWSPKGKQLVVGKKDGSLSQHVPNLQIAKTVAAPTIFETIAPVISIAWLSSYQFAVVYCVENRPSLVVVNSSKAKPTTYHNFDDICYGTSDQRPHQYFMIHHPELRLLICSSSNAMEVGVLAAKDDGLEWEQWTLEDFGRAELPLIKDDETYPLGMSLDTTSQREILIGDTICIPPKPILYLLSTGGVVCPYYMISDTYKAPLVKAPEPFNLLVGITKNANSSVIKTTPQQISQSNIMSSPATGTNFAKENLLPKFNEISKLSTPSVVQNAPTSKLPDWNSNLSMTPSTVASALPTSSLTTLGSITMGKLGPPTAQVGSITSGTPVSSAILWKTPPPSNFPPALTSVNFPQSIHQSSGFHDVTTVSHNRLSKPVPISQPQQFPSKPFALGKEPTQLSTIGSSVSGFSALGKPSLASSSAPKVDSFPHQSTTGVKNVTTTELPRKVPGQTALMTAYYEELSNFGNEVAQVKERAQQMVANLRTNKEDYILAEIEHTRKFLEKAKKTTKAMNVDIHSLRGSILDIFAAIEEGRSLENRTKNKRFIHLLKSRGLDPLSAKKMREIRSVFYYLENQVAEVNSLLDRIWEEFQSNRKSGLAQIPNMELIYRSMTTNHSIACNLHQQMEKLDMEVIQVQSYRQPLTFLSSKKDDRTKSYVSFSSNPIPHTSVISEGRKRGGALSDLRSLSDALMNSDTISSLSMQSSACKLKKNLTHEKIALLRNVLEKRPVTKVRPPSPVMEFSQLISPVANLNEKLEGNPITNGSNSKAPVSELSPSTVISSSNILTSLSPNVTKTEKGKLNVTPEQSLRAFITPITTLATAKPGTLNSKHPAYSAVMASTTSTASISAATSFQQSTNIFTLAATSSKEELPFPLRIGGITLESKPKHDVTPEIAKSPMLSSLLEKPPVSSLSPIAAPPTFQSVGNSSTVPPFTFSSSNVQNFSFNWKGDAADKTHFATPALQAFKFTTPIDAKSAPLTSESKKVSGNEFVYEDVTPPCSPHNGRYTIRQSQSEHVGHECEEQEEVEGEEEEEVEGEEEEEVEGEEEEEEEVDEDGVPVGEGEFKQLHERVTCNSVGEGVDNADEFVGSTILKTSKQVEASDGQKVTDTISELTSHNLAKSRPDEAKDWSLVVTKTESPQLTNVSTSTSIFTLPTTASSFTEASSTLTSLLSSGSSAPPTAVVTTLPTFTSSGVQTFITSTESTSAKADSEGMNNAATVDSVSSLAQNLPGTFRFISPVAVTTSSTATETSSVPFLFTLPTTSSSSSTAVVATSNTTTAATIAAAPTTPTTNVVTSLSTTGKSPESFPFSIPSKATTDGTSQNALVATDSISSAVAIPTLSSATQVSTAPVFSSVGGTAQPVFGTQSSFQLSTTSTNQSKFGDITPSKSVFGGQTAFAFSQPGASSFGSSQGSAFGVGVAVFGQAQQKTSTSSPGPTFGQQSTSTTSQSSMQGVFVKASGGFFSGLGAKPNPENANKNIFGEVSTFGSSAVASTNLFGGTTNQGSGPFWNRPSGSSSGSGFGSSGFSNTSGSVGQTGFGGFQQSPTQPGGFGGAPAFGSSPTFGGAPTFGGVTQIGSGIFGSSTSPSPSFASFATNDAPTFGSLAAQTSTPTFGSLALQPSTPSFGATPAIQSSFGVAPVFGGSPGFGSQPMGDSTAPQGSPSFSQWRS